MLAIVSANICGPTQMHTGKMLAVAVLALHYESDSVLAPNKLTYRGCLCPVLACTCYLAGPGHGVVCAAVLQLLAGSACKEALLQSARE